MRGRTARPAEGGKAAATCFKRYVFENWFGEWYWFGKWYWFVRLSVEYVPLVNVR